MEVSRVESGPADLEAPGGLASLLRTRPSLHRLLILAAVVVVDSAVFWTLQPRFGIGVRAVFVFHVTTAGLLFGWRGGLLAGLSAVPLGVGLYMAMGPQAQEAVSRVGLAVGGVAMTVVGSAVGAVTDLSVRLREEILLRKRTAKELLEAQRRHLEAAMEAQLLRATRLASLGTLAAGVAHEINNPLGYLTSNLRSIRCALAGSEAPAPEQMKDVREALDESIEGAERIDGIVKAIRVFSPRPSEELGEVLEVRAISASALEAVESRLRDRATVVCRIEGEPTVLGNRDRLGQVLLNLLLNAAESLPDRGSDANRVTLTGRTDRDRVLIEVSDTGRGIPPEVLPQIFEPFFSTKPESAGTGLGLFVCKGIVGAMGGNLTVRTEPGKGTTFCVDLPSAKR